MRAKETEEDIYKVGGSLHPLLLSESFICSTKLLSQVKTSSAITTQATQKKAHYNVLTYITRGKLGRRSARNDGVRKLRHRSCRRKTDFPSRLQSRGFTTPSGCFAQQRLEVGVRVYRRPFRGRELHGNGELEGEED
jgi:hypothetical protein